MSCSLLNLFQALQPLAGLDAASVRSGLPCQLRCGHSLAVLLTSWAQEASDQASSPIAPTPAHFVFLRLAVIGLAQHLVSSQLLNLIVFSSHLPTFLGLVTAPGPGIPMF